MRFSSFPQILRSWGSYTRRFPILGRVGFPSLEITTPLNILTRHLQDHQYHTYTTPSLNTDLKYEATLKPHRFQTAKNNMTDTFPPPNPGCSRTTTSSSDVRSIDKMKTSPTIYPPYAVCFMTKTAKHDKTTSVSDLTTLQVGQDVTYIYSNVYRVP